MSDTVPNALVVEDDLEIRACLRHALLGDGWQVAEAETLEGALASAGRQPLDLIVLDLGLPESDCVAFITHIRQQSEVPIVVMAARVDGAKKMHALAAGANDYLSKLFGIGERFDAILCRFRPGAARQHGECHE